MTNCGWVKAKDLTVDHHLSVPSRVSRATSPTWATKRVAELLGCIAACASITTSEDVIFIEVPNEYAGFVEAPLQLIMGKWVYLNRTETTTVFHFRIEDALSLEAKGFMVALPEASGGVFPPELRGTTAVYDYLRGFFLAGARFTDNKGTSIRLPRIYVEVKKWELVSVLIRETLLEGMIPPSIRFSRGRYLVWWQGTSAGHMAKAAGIPRPLWRTKQKNDRLRTQYAALKVSRIEPAKAGWVYDFTVPSTHDFYANGMLVHNTVPKHSYWGGRIRECIVAPPGHVILARDYSQGELKVAACWAGESKMIQAYKAGVDLHTLTAATVTGMSYEEAMYLKKVDYDAYAILRQNGKAGNFGLLYGMSAYGFMMYAAAVYGVHLTIEEAEHMRDAYFNLYPGLLDWHAKQIAEAQVTGMVRSPLGRLRRLPLINSPIKSVRKGANNQAINSPIQGTLGDMMWMSMGIIEKERPSLLTPFAQVHDQGLWYVPEDDVDEALQYSGHVMEGLPFEEKFGWSPELTFNTDAEIGYDLFNLKKVAS